MKRFFALLTVSAACLALTISAAPQTLPVLYDSSIKVPVPSASSSDIARVYKELLRVGGAQIKNQCFDDKLPATPKLIGLARGAFTRKGSSQTAWLFESCATKRYQDSGFYGLVIVENQRVVRVSSVQLTSVYGFATELYGVRDINLNGTDELALVWGSADGGGSIGVLALLEQTPKSLGALGQILVYQSDSIDIDRKPVTSDWKAYVIKGNSPVFIGTLKSGVGAPVRLSLDKPELELQTFLVR